MTLASEFLQSSIKRLTGYKQLAEKTFDQLTDADMHYQSNSENNSIAVIVQHMSGNMLSRWTDFLTSDGEKEWRNRDTEFEIFTSSKETIIAQWEKGWQCLFDALRDLKDDDLLKTVYIRSEPLLVVDAIIRQMAHYPYHVGQIVFIGKTIKSGDWKNLSIAKGASNAYNNGMKKK